VRHCGGRPTPQDKLHVTVAFLGSLTAEELARAAAVPAPEVGSFELEFDTLGYWARRKILWLAPSRVPEALLALEQVLWERLRAQGFVREPRIFRPHLTLCRRARECTEAVKPVHWRVCEVTLMESIGDDQGGRYEPLRAWPLRAAEDAFSANEGKTVGCDDGDSVK
jgi:2'-5' RNA ligase